MTTSTLNQGGTIGAIPPVPTDGTHDAAGLIAILRFNEDLFFRLGSMAINSLAGGNSFYFEPAWDRPLPDPTEYLDLELFPSATDAQGQAAACQDFVSTGGVIAASGVVKINSTPVFAVAYRGPLPDKPAPHTPALASPPNDFPSHVLPIFEAGGQLAGIPWDRAELVSMPLIGLKQRTLKILRDYTTGLVQAFAMMTDADIDTDGPGGSKAVDPDYGPGTSLVYPGGASCDSRQFPGVVRSALLYRRPLGLGIGDFAYICYKGRVVACQIYDQGPDEKIGEISLYAGRQVGGVPASWSDALAASSGNFADQDMDLVTLCFPGSNPGRRAMPISDIEAHAKNCLDALVQGASTGVFKPQPVALPSQPSAPAGPTGEAAGQTVNLTIYQRSSWAALPPKVAAFARGEARGIVIHNTEGPNRTPGSDDSLEVPLAMEVSREIQRDHMFDNVRKHWSDIGQHFTVSRGGIIMEGRAGTLDATKTSQVVQGAHAGLTEYNCHWWGIEIEGDYRLPGTAPTPEQQSAVFCLCAWLAALISGYDADTQLKGHKQANPAEGTDCPGLLLDPDAGPDFLQQIRNFIQSPLQINTPEVI